MSLTVIVNTDSLNALYIATEPLTIFDSANVISYAYFGFHNTSILEMEITSNSTSCSGGHSLGAFYGKGGREEV